MSNSEAASKYDSYRCPLESRYASKEMCFNFSDRKRFTTWRKIWYYLADSQRKLGVNITDEQLQELKQNINEVDFQKAIEEEKKTRHDVMAHVNVYAQQCPKAASIIHYGATSCDIVDNADLIIIRDGLDILLPKIGECIKLLSQFADEHKDLPTLGYTHLQPAQPTTVGKRACMWLQDLLISERCVSNSRNELQFRGIKGTTGTQASFLRLFDGDYEKVKALDDLVTERVGFAKSYSATGQTYPRIVDVVVLQALATFSVAAKKICTDVRLLSNFNEIREPIEKTQIGSSAMPYKQNPIRNERVCSIARHLKALLNNVMDTASEQWLERTLDDSANRRISIPEAFLAADSIVRLLQNIFQGLRVFPEAIKSNMLRELPLLASENIIIAVVNAGGNRQECHDKIRTLSREVEKEESEATAHCSNLIEKIKNDPYFEKIRPQLSSILDPKTFTGCASLQVSEFLENDVAPILKKYAHLSVDSVVLEN